MIPVNVGDTVVALYHEPEGDATTFVCHFTEPTDEIVGTVTNVGDFCGRPCVVLDVSGERLMVAAKHIIKMVAPNRNGGPHLSECMLMYYPGHAGEWGYRCTCDDVYPDL